MWRRPAEAGVVASGGGRTKEFVNMIRRAAWTALAVRRAVPADRPPDDRFHR